MSDAPDLHCRICGYEWDEPPWGTSGRLPIFQLCPCCCVETGYQDNNPVAARRYRAEWLAKGAPWAFDDVPHDGLTTEERLAYIPPGFR